jgi:hypothetical protein
MSDMLATIVAKSDQLNADDLVGRALTITVEGVEIKPGTDQPVTLFYEGHGGKPYKPGLSMRRVLVKVWGPDAKTYVGRSMTLYRDEGVRYGGMEVGGIRISHMSHIDRPVTLALTATRANKKPFTVKPLQTHQPRLRAAPSPATQEPVVPPVPAPEPSAPPDPPTEPPAEPMPIPEPAEQTPPEPRPAATAAEVFVDETERGLQSIHASGPREIIEKVEGILLSPKFKARGEKLRLQHKPLYARLIKAFAHPVILDHAMQAVNGQYEVFYFDLLKEAEGKQAA